MWKVLQDKVNWKKCAEQVNENLQYFVDYCHQYGMAAEAYAAFGTDTVEELTTLI